MSIKAAKNAAETEMHAKLVLSTERRQSETNERESLDFLKFRFAEISSGVRGERRQDETSSGTIVCSHVSTMFIAIECVRCVRDEVVEPAIQMQKLC